MEGADMAATQKIERVEITNRYDGEIQWFLGADEGPLGRTARVLREAARLVKVTRVNDETGEEEEVEEQEGFYSRPVTVTLFNPGAKQVAEIPGLRGYDADSFARRWVEEGR
jgi:hypothetical protein